MQPYAYKVIPAPVKGTKAKGVKTPEGRFAQSLEDVMNKMAAEGWEFQRAETLPSEERSGLRAKTTKFRNVLVFRKQAAAEVVEVLPVADISVPEVMQEPAPRVEPVFERHADVQAETAPEPDVYRIAQGDAVADEDTQEDQATRA